MGNKIAYLDSDVVERYRRKRGFTVPEIAGLLGYRSRQGYYYMLKSRILVKVPILAKIFGLEKKDLVVIDC